MKRKEPISFSTEEYEEVKRNIIKYESEIEALKEKFENDHKISGKTKRVKTQEERDEEKRRKEERKKASQQRKEETKQRIEEKKKEEEEQRRKRKEEEREKFLDSLVFDVRKPVEIDPIYDNKPIFKTEKTDYDMIREMKGSRIIEHSKIMAAQEAVQKRQIEMLRAIERLENQKQTIISNEQEL